MEKRRKKLGKQTRCLLTGIGEGLKFAGRYISKTVRRLLEALKRFCAGINNRRIQEYIIAQLKRNGFLIDATTQASGRRTAKDNAALQELTGKNTDKVSARKQPAADRVHMREARVSERSSSAVYGRKTATVRYGRTHSGTRKNVRTPAIRKHRRRGRFAERHLRSLTAFGLLVCALIAFMSWGNLSADGMRTFASLGIGKAQGYVLLGDDCMRGGN